MTPPLAASPAPYQRFPTPHAAVRRAPPRPSKLRRRSSALGAPTGAAPSGGRRSSHGQPALPRAGAAPSGGRRCYLGPLALLPRARPQGSSTGCVRVKDAPCPARPPQPSSSTTSALPQAAVGRCVGIAPLQFSVSHGHLTQPRALAAGRRGPPRGHRLAPDLGVARRAVRRCCIGGRRCHKLLMSRRRCYILPPSLLQPTGGAATTRRRRCYTSSGELRSCR
jgi:hypothetical protein